MCIMKRVWKELLQIPIEICKAIMENLIFPKKPPTTKEQLIKKVKRLSFMLRSKQDRGIYQIRRIRELSQGNHERDDLIERKDKEIRILKARIRSLELQLYVMNSRSMRWR